MNKSVIKFIGIAVTTTLFGCKVCDPLKEQEAWFDLYTDRFLAAQKTFDSCVLIRRSDSSYDFPVEPVVNLAISVDGLTRHGDSLHVLLFQGNTRMLNEMKAKGPVPEYILQEYNRLYNKNPE